MLLSLRFTHLGVSYSPDTQFAEPQISQSFRHTLHRDTDTSKIRNGEFKEKESDVWRLFREAQQNILYLKKQRIMTLEELDRMNREKDSLLDRVEQLEAMKLSGATKGHCAGGEEQSNSQSSSAYSASLHQRWEGYSGERIETIVDNRTVERDVRLISFCGLPADGGPSSRYFSFRVKRKE